MFRTLQKISWDLGPENAVRVYVAVKQWRFQLEMVFQHSTVNSCVGNDFPVQHSQLQCWKSFSCSAKSTPALEMVFQHSTVNSCLGNDFPVQHSQLQRWKQFSCSAQSTPVLEIILLHSKVNSRAGNHFPIQQKRLQRSNVNFRTATA